MLALTVIPSILLREASTHTSLRMMASPSGSFLAMRYPLISRLSPRIHHLGRRPAPSFHPHPAVSRTTSTTTVSPLIPHFAETGPALLTVGLVLEHVQTQLLIPPTSIVCLFIMPVICPIDIDEHSSRPLGPQLHCCLSVIRRAHPNISITIISRPFSPPALYHKRIHCDARLHLFLSL